MIRTLTAAALTLAAFTAPALAATCDTRGMPPEMYTSYARDIQQQLTEHGFRAGPVDGKPGRQTQSAIRAYQKAARLPVDGCVSKELADHLHFAQPKVYGGAKR
jgi:peptidoglycan hydrolase-like protein with peptidoglycan-binding domain